MRSLFDEAVDLLHKRRMSLREIADSTGLGVQWLYKLNQGHIANPSVRRIERLVLYLRHAYEKAA